MNTDREVAKRFWSKIAVREGGCWDWTASLSGAGYAQLWDGERLVGAHRWSYEWFVGPIPEGLTLDHLCRRPACQNPSHLEPVTQRENLMRAATAWAAINAAKTHCIHGHPLSGANLYVYPTSGKRMCRECQRVNTRERRRRLRDGLVPA